MSKRQLFPKYLRIFSDRLLRPIRSQIMLRSMLAILTIAICAGVLVLGISYQLLRRIEEDRLHSGLDETMSAVAGTASIAAFTSDTALASEVLRGLLANPAVARAEIRVVSHAKQMTLVSLDNIIYPEQILGSPRLKILYSPFSKDAPVGELAVYPEEVYVNNAAAKASDLIALLLALELVAVAFAVGFVVFVRVTRPIRQVASDLHKLEPGSGDILWPPRGNASDEIGQLVSDVNFLIARMQSSILNERDMSDAMARSERKYRLIFENAETGIFVLDYEGRLQSWNPMLERFLGHESFTQNAPTLAELLHAKPERVQDLINQAFAYDRAASADFELPSPSGASEHFSIVLNPISDQALQGICHDISERKRAEMLALAMAESDPLTGLLNRRGFEIRATQIIQHTNKFSGVALLMIDLDGFKTVNDALGHKAGDEVLVGTARRLEQLVRKKDLIARVGGDEFVILLSAIASGETAMSIARKIIKALMQPFPLCDRPETAQIGASIGVALGIESLPSIEDLLFKADQAMYRVKNSGKNNIQLA
jgi:diguanylate cyclase (GGDEF)-like protein/PAS domain S-box-containing protein